MVANLKVSLISFNEMRLIYNSYGIDYKSYMLDSICTKIVNNNNELTLEDSRILYSLFGNMLTRAGNIIDDEKVELLTIADTDRSYFSVQGSSSFYTLYLHINACQCVSFKYSILKKKGNAMCKHILACHLANATKKYKTRTTNDLVYSFS